MGFDVNGQGNSATVDLPPSSRNPSLPPKSTMATATPSSSGGRKPSAAASSMSSTPVSSGSGGGYSLYSLIKKQSQSTAQRSAVSITSPAKNAPAGSLPVGVLKKPSSVAGLTGDKPSTDSAKTGAISRSAAVSFAVDPVEKAATVDLPDSVRPHRFVIFVDD